MARTKAEPGKVSKTKMVLAALDHFGDDGEPADMQPWIKDTYGEEISRQMISSYKSNLLKKKRGGVPVGGDGSGLGVRDVAVLQDMIGRVGAGELSALIRVLAK
jgi:hypothetical protein